MSKGDIKRHGLLQALKLLPCYSFFGPNDVSLPAERADRHKGRAGDEGPGSEGWEASSSLSASTMASLRDFDANETEDIEDDPWERAIEALYEKRCDSQLVEHDNCLCICYRTSSLSSVLYQLFCTLQAMSRRDWLAGRQRGRGLWVQWPTFWH